MEEKKEMKKNEQYEEIQKLGKKTYRKALKLKLEAKEKAAQIKYAAKMQKKNLWAPESQSWMKYKLLKSIKFNRKIFS